MSKAMILQLIEHRSKLSNELNIIAKKPVIRHNDITRDLRSNNDFAYLMKVHKYNVQNIPWYNLIDYMLNSSDLGDLGDLRNDELDLILASHNEVVEDIEL